MVEKHAKGFREQLIGDSSTAAGRVLCYDTGVSFITCGTLNAEEIWRMKENLGNYKLLLTFPTLSDGIT